MKVFSIGLIGMEPKDLLSLKSLMRVFKASSRDREYRIVESGNCDIMVVNMDTDFGVKASENATGIVVGAYSDAVPDNLKYAIKKPLIGRKVINVFDQITVKEFSFAPELSINLDGGSEAEKQGLQRLEEFEESFSEASTIITGERSATSNIRALVIDDSEVVRKALEILLAGKNIDVTSVDDGSEALKLIDEKRYYDIVFLDVVMPEVDGYKVCKKLKKSEYLRDSKVVMLTSKSSKFDRIRASLVGCDHYLTKPISQQDFLEFVDGFLKTRSKNGHVNKAGAPADKGGVFMNPKVTPGY